MSSTISPFKVWIRLYAVAANKDAKVIEQKLAPTLRHFNSRMANARANQGFNNADMCALIYYAFLYNPLKIEVTEYGKLDNILASVREFAWFCKDHAEDILSIGVIQTVIKFAPDQSKTKYGDTLDVNVKRYI